MPVRNHLGSRFGRLTVDGYAGLNKRRGARWFCVCECGARREVSAADLVSGHTRSCGCLLSDVARAIGRSCATHRAGLTPTYRTWIAMRRRCLSERCDKYESYGGRGIGICERWGRFENFRDDMGERPAGMTIDRIDNAKGYEPSNCRWATPATQTRNRACSKLTEEDATDIRRLRANGDRAAYIAEIYDVSVGAINAVIAGRAWK